MRIFDRIASGDSVYVSTGLTADGMGTAYWRKAANTAVRVVADEPAQFYWQTDRRPVIGRKDGQFGQVVPPFPQMWIEWQTPSHVMFQGQWMQAVRTRMAVVIEAQETDAGQLLACRTLTTEDGRPIAESPVCLRITATDLGAHLVPEMEFDTAKAQDFLQRLGEPDLTPERVMLDMFHETSPAILAIGWMNCKNGRMTDESPPSRLMRKRLRRGQMAGLDYKKLTISGDAVKALRENRAAAEAGRRLHMVRGHFATYTTPMGGHDYGFVGTVWRSWHVRGSADLGRITHEYHPQVGQ